MSLARLVVASLLAVAVAVPAHADIAPDPVETGGIAAIGLGLVALVIFLCILGVRRLRANKSAHRR